MSLGSGSAGGVHETTLRGYVRSRCELSSDLRPIRWKEGNEDSQHHSNEATNEGS